MEEDGFEITEEEELEATATLADLYNVQITELGEIDQDIPWTMIN